MMNNFRVTVEAFGVVPARVEDIKAAIARVWPIETSDLVRVERGFKLLCIGTNVANGVNGIPDTLSRAIWEANRRYCQIKITTCLLIEERVYNESDY
jgi:hypothetical protein